ncbi:MAG: DUF2934 domain-containing protein [Bryobacteraceae bacterium]|nr:DUF2934 domain-containing protein [Bryobacteraceae bacterium]
MATKKPSAAAAAAPAVAPKKTTARKTSAPKAATKKAAAPKKTVIPKVAPKVATVPVSLEDEIRTEAYNYYVQRGYHPGDPLADWRRAEDAVLRRHGLR